MWDGIESAKTGEYLAIGHHHNHNILSAKFMWIRMKNRFFFFQTNKKLYTFSYVSFSRWIDVEAINAGNNNNNNEAMNPNRKIKQKNMFKELMVICIFTSHSFAAPFHVICFFFTHIERTKRFFFTPIFHNSQWSKNVWEWFIVLRRTLPFSLYQYICILFLFIFISCYCCCMVSCVICCSVFRRRIFFRFT